MFLKKIVVLHVVVLFALLVSSCSGSFDKETGMYINTGDGFSILFPGGWEETKTQAGALVTVTGSDKSAQMNIIVQELPDDMSLDMFYRNVSSQAGRVGARMIDKGVIKIDGEDARRAHGDITVGGLRFSSMNYYVMKGRKVYSIVGTSAHEDFNVLRDEFTRSVESFRFLE